MASRKTQDALAKSAKNTKVQEEPKAEVAAIQGLTRAGAAEKEVAILREREAAAPERILPTLERIAKALEGVEVLLGDATERSRRSPVKAAKVLDLKAAQQAFLDVIAKDREHAVRTLKGFMVERVSALPPEKFQTFVQALAGE